MWHFTGFVLHYVGEEFGFWGPLCREAARISNFLSSPCQTADCEKIGQARPNFMLHRQHLNEVGKWYLPQLYAELVTRSIPQLTAK